MTKFADLSLEEYKETALTKITHSDMVFDEVAEIKESNADAINWVAKGAVTPIKD
jgi:hypothetical protein